MNQLYQLPAMRREMFECKTEPSFFSWERGRGHVHSRRLADNRSLSDGEGPHAPCDVTFPPGLSERSPDRDR